MNNYSILMVSIIGINIPLNMLFCLLFQHYIYLKLGKSPTTPKLREALPTHNEDLRYALKSLISLQKSFRMEKSIHEIVLIFNNMYE